MTEQEWLPLSREEKARQEAELLSLQQKLLELQSEKASGNYITRAAAAKLLGVSPGMVSSYIKGGRLKGSFKLGRAWAIPREAVEKLIRVRPVAGFKRGRKLKGEV